MNLGTLVFGIGGAGSGMPVAASLTGAKPSTAVLGAFANYNGSGTPVRTGIALEKAQATTNRQLSVGKGVAGTDGTASATVDRDGASSAGSLIIFAEGAA